jgi:hypothetical protein
LRVENGNRFWGIFGSVDFLWAGVEKPWLGTGGGAPFKWRTPYEMVLLGTSQISVNWQMGKAAA